MQPGRKGTRQSTSVPKNNLGIFVFLWVGIASRMCGKPSEVIVSCVSLRGASRKPLLSPKMVKIDRFRRWFYEALLIPHFHAWMGLGCPTSPQMTTKEPEVPVSLLGTSRKPLLLRFCHNTISRCPVTQFIWFTNGFRMHKWFQHVQHVHKKCLEC